jgi:enoyl-CoA hydratase
MNHILYEEKGPVGIITMNREEKLNAMNTAIVKRLIELFQHINDSPKIRCAILTGKGKAFIAGADIEEYSVQGVLEFAEYQKRSRRMFEGIECNKKPFIAAVNGYALGGGFELVLSCDLVLASKRAKMGLPEINLGLLPGGGGTQKLARLIGRNWAKELLMTGRRLTAEEAFNLRIVNQICEPEELEEKAMALANQLAIMSPTAISEMKSLVNQGMESNIQIGLSLEGSSLSNLFQTEDAQEGIKAFVEKRKPVFIGR